MTSNHPTVDRDATARGKTPRTVSNVLKVEEHVDDNGDPNEPGPFSRCGGNENLRGYSLGQTKFDQKIQFKLGGIFARKFCDLEVPISSISAKIF